MTGFENKPRFGALPYILGGVLGISLGLLIVSGVLFFKPSRGSNEPDRASNIPSYQTTEDAIAEGRRNAIVNATDRVAPAVVSISARQTRTVRNDFFSRFFGNQDAYRRQEYNSLGSGIIIDIDGYLLTNEHVIRNAEDIQVTLSNGETVSGQLVDAAPDYDLALLKIDGGPFEAAELGDSDSLLVGEWAIAIGSPFGQMLNDTQPTVTVGVISALHRDVKSDPRSQQIFKGMVQTDAAINPGNSGGPLVNSRGEVVGINTFILSGGTGSNIGIGFAIPINRGKWIIDEIRNYGRVRDVWVGLTVSSVRPALAMQLGLQAKRGLLVRELEIDSPAYKSGLKPGDVIVQVNGAKVRSTYEANRVIFGSHIGDKLEFKVNRNGEHEEFTVVLEEKPNRI